MKLYIFNADRWSFKIKAVREMYPTEKVAVVFQPHLFSRTRDFVDAFAESLSQFDAVFLLEIYPARELPKNGLARIA